MSARELIILIVKIAFTALVIIVIVSRSKDVGKPRAPLSVGDVILQVCIDMMIVAWIWWPR